MEMREGTSRISDAEWDVMEVVWALGSATPAEVIERVAEARGWSHRTVRTLLSRLVEKGALRREGDGARSVYRAVVSRRSVTELGRSFLNKVFGGDSTLLLLHFAREAKVGPKELDRLKRLLEEKTTERGP
jgi:BlaI family transcriptional regulator, penicillinase repressor